MAKHNSVVVLLDHARAMDSSGKPIAVGDVVRWRSHLYVIKAFGERIGAFDTLAIEFTETPHLTDEQPCEASVDLVERRAPSAP